MNVVTIGGLPASCRANACRVGVWDQTLLAIAGIFTMGLMAVGATPAFTNLDFTILPVTSGNVAWADYDHDGRLDIVLAADRANFPYQQVWQSTGSSFTAISAFPTARADYPMSLGDFDNDGRWDLLSCGAWARNTGTSPGFTSLETIFWYGASDSADLDNDGRLDVISLGRGLNFPPQGFSINLSSGSTIAARLLSGPSPASTPSSIALGDYDNDGWVDFAVGGAGLWRNTGVGFQHVEGLGLLPGTGGIIWGDIDNDGRLDLVSSIGGQFTEIWRNTTNGFVNLGQNLQFAWQNAMSLADYDNDGRLDLLLGGTVWRNTGGGFSNINAGPPVWPTLPCAWGDYDSDGRMDIFVAPAGLGTMTPVWQNVSSIVSNTPPSAPSNLTAAVTGQGVRFGWNAATDAQTPSSGLTYNLRVGTTPGGFDVVSPLADPATGTRRIVKMGNAQMRLFTILTNLPDGLYFWSVQAIDTSFSGSAFATEKSFLIGNPTLAFTSETRLSNGGLWIQMTGIPRAQHTLHFSTNLLAWPNSTSMVAGSNGFLEYFELGISNEPRRFFRLSFP